MLSRFRFFTARVGNIVLGSLICNCNQNYSDHATVQTLAHDASFQSALQESQRDPGNINTLCVQSNGQSLPILTAAMMREDDATIKLLLNQGADIRVADQEGQGILHALVSNPRPSDQQKAALVDDCFRRVKHADNIRTNQTDPFRRTRRGNPGRLRETTPWLKAWHRGQRQTALRIVKHMSFRQADTDGLYHALRGRSQPRWHYNDFTVGNENLIQILLDKESDYDAFTQAAPILVRAGLPEGVILNVRKYTCKAIDVNRRSMSIDDWHPWAYAWVVNNDAELAIRIIEKIP